MKKTILTTATQQRNLQGNSQGEPHPISIETHPIAPIIDAARIFTARMKRISTILIMSVLVTLISACGGGGGGGTSPGEDKKTEGPISVSNLRVIPDTNNATLIWNNPNVNITQINISYKLSTADNFTLPIPITDNARLARSKTDVMGMISSLMSDTNYTFRVTLELGGADENKSVMAAEITRLIGSNLDGDEYADTDPLDPDSGGGGDVAPPPPTDNILISVLNLRVFPDVSSAILMWDNPDAVIANISISYKLSTADNFGTPITIMDDARLARNEIDVMGMIPVGLLTTPNVNYTFSVTLELKGADEGKSVAAAEITRLIGPNFDGDEYADAEDVDDDNDGVNDLQDAFPTDGALSAFTVSRLRAAAGDKSVTLKWNNPDAQIASINISYKRTGSDDEPMTRSSDQTTSGALNVEETITELTNGQSYNFTVSLILRDTDVSKKVEAQSISATPVFIVTGLYGVAGADYVILSWTNPDAEIDGISISYQRRGSDNPETPLLIADDPKRAANASVQHNISGLMPDRYYDFTVSVRSGGSDEDGEGAPSISVLVNPDYDGDGKNNFVDVDADGDGLIEIATAQQFNQSRHNLQGSNFTRSAGGVGDANGCGNGTMEGEDVTACNGYELIADIYLAAYVSWEPIGRCMNYDPDAFMCTPATEFLNAIFDGNNRTINDLTITNHDGSYDNASGLFGAISSTSVLRNIHIRSANLIGGGLNVGLLVGYAKGAMIINSSAEGAVTASGDNVGGLVGFGDNAEITSSYAAGGAVSGGDNVGGLVGGGFDSTITSSYAAGGNVSGGDNIGGLIGLGRSSIITSSYAAGGSVSGGDEVGGLVGDGFGGSTIITSSYAAGGAVSGTGDVGGLVGTGSGSVITFSYWDSDKSGQPSDSDDSLGVNKTTQELKTPTENDPGIYSTWASDMCADGTTRTWDFGTSSDYPALRCTPNGLPAQQHLRQR